MGGAYVATGSKQMRTDLAFAWPTARIAVMGAEPAVHVLYRKEVREAPETRPRLIRALELLRTKVQQSPPEKHGLPPN